MSGDQDFVIYSNPEIVYKIASKLEKLNQELQDVMKIAESCASLQVSASQSSELSHKMCVDTHSSLVAAIQVGSARLIITSVEPILQDIDTALELESQEFGMSFLLLNRVLMESAKEELSNMVHNTQEYINNIDLSDDKAANIHDNAENVHYTDL